MDVAELGAERGGARHGGVHVQPESVLAADAPISGSGSMAFDEVVPDGGADEARDPARRLVLRNLPRQRIGAHGEVLVDLDRAQVLCARCRRS